jgi:hypothetical protein
MNRASVTFLTNQTKVAQPPSNGGFNRFGWIELEGQITQAQPHLAELRDEV